MRLETDNNQNDGFKWRCRVGEKLKDGQICTHRQKNKEVFKHDKKRSIRYYSFFEESKLHVIQCSVLASNYVNGSTHKSLVDQFGFSSRTVVNWCNFVRDVYCEWLRRFTDELHLGGPGIFVQVDESLFGRRCKYHRGAKKGMVFGCLV